MSVRYGSTNIVFNPRNEREAHFWNKTLPLRYNINWEEEIFSPYIYVKVHYNASESDEYSHGFIVWCDNITLKINDKIYTDNRLKIKLPYLIMGILRKEWIYLSKEDYNLIRKTYSLLILSECCDEKREDSISCWVINNMKFSWKIKRWKNIVIDKWNNIYIFVSNKEWKKKKIIITFSELYNFMWNLYQNIRYDISDVEFS